MGSVIDFLSDFGCEPIYEPVLGDLGRDPAGRPESRNRPRSRGSALQPDPCTRRRVPGSHARLGLVDRAADSARDRGLPSEGAGVTARRVRYVHSRPVDQSVAAGSRRSRGRSAWPARRWSRAGERSPSSRANNRSAAMVPIRVGSWAITVTPGCSRSASGRSSKPDQRHLVLQPELVQGPDGPDGDQVLRGEQGGRRVGPVASAAAPRRTPPARSAGCRCGADRRRPARRRSWRR